ncbi:YHS domain-containing protein [Streptomyces sp. NBC_00024]
MRNLPPHPVSATRGRPYLFCSDACKERFTADPDRYTENQ